MLSGHPYSFKCDKKKKKKKKKKTIARQPGAVARSEACPLGMQAALSSIPTFGTYFREDLVMKKNSTAILPLSLIQEEQLSVTGERLVNCIGGLPRNCVVKVTDRPRNDLKCVEGLENRNQTKNNTWAAARLNQQNHLCAQQSWASAQSDQSLRCALNG